MALLRIDEPGVEPVSLEEAKLLLRIDAGDDDALVSSLITAARTHIERLLGRALITQTWLEARDSWPSDRSAVHLSLAPTQDVLAVRVFDVNGTAHTLASGTYFVDRISEPARLCSTGSAVWPAPGRSVNGIEIEFAAGYGDLPGDVPSPLRQAILLLVVHWYEQRTPADAIDADGEVPGTVAGLLAPYRLRRVS